MEDQGPTLIKAFSLSTVAKKAFLIFRIDTLNHVFYLSFVFFNGSIFNEFIFNEFDYPLLKEEEHFSVFAQQHKAVILVSRFSMSRLSLSSFFHLVLQMPAFEKSYLSFGSPIDIKKFGVVVMREQHVGILR